MTKDEIIKLARQVGFPINNPEWQKAVEEFAALCEEAGRTAEREECAKLCDAQHDRARTSTGAARADACADAIRARGRP